MKELIIVYYFINWVLFVWCAVIFDFSYRPLSLFIMKVSDLRIYEIKHFWVELKNLLTSRSCSYSRVSPLVLFWQHAWPVCLRYQGQLNLLDLGFHDHLDFWNLNHLPPEIVETTLVVSRFSLKQLDTRLVSGRFCQKWLKIKLVAGRFWKKTLKIAVVSRKKAYYRVFFQVWVGKTG